MTSLRLLPLIALALAAPLGAQDEGRALPAWLAGSWQMQQGAAWAEELWTEPRDGMMLGVEREGFGPQVEGWQVQRIQRKPGGMLVLIVQPKGGAAVEYTLTVASEEAIEFANPLHDYPQRIRWWRQGQLLMAEMSRIDGSQPTRLNYRPVAGPTDGRE
jgi:hypothetical protein